MTIEEVIGVLEYDSTLEEAMYNEEFYEQLVDLLKELMALRKNNYRWIPVAERLPEEDPANDYYTVVMVTLADGSVTAGFYRNDNCEWWSLRIDEFERVKYNQVIAWMPFPDPYKDVKE